MTTDNGVDFDTAVPRVEQILRKLLGENATINLSRGFEGRIRVKVVSPKFNGLCEAEKSRAVWETLDAEMKEDVGKISFVIAYSTDEL